MTHQQQSSTQWSRDYLKCDQCRREHKKCSPRARDWDGQRKKCDRCCHLGHPCGPAIRAQRSLPADRNSLTEDIGPLQRRTPRYDTLATTTVDATASNARSVEIRTTYGGSTCLVNLAAMIATHELLLLQLLSIERRSHNPKTDVVRGTIIATIERVHRAFQRATESLQDTIVITRGMERELLSWKMAYFDEWHYHLMNITSLSKAKAYVSERSRRAACIPHDTPEARILACTSRVLDDAQMDSRSQLQRSHPVREDYLDLESYIKTLFLNIQDADAEDSSLIPSTRRHRSSVRELNSFPASHIAYFNQDREIALRLWKRIPGQQSSINILGRLFVHVATASRDLETITKVTNHAPDALEHCPDDELGLNLIDLVDDSGNHTIRTFLHQMGAKSTLDQSRVLPRSGSIDPARFADVQNFPHLATAIRSNDLLTFTSVEAMQDLEHPLSYSQARQSMENIASGDPMVSSLYQIPDQTFMHGNYFTHGQEIAFQSPQPFSSSVLFGSMNNDYSTSGSQFPPGQFYNAHYNPGRSNG